MAYTIVDNDEAFNTNQSLIMQTDIDALVAGIGANGVISGCAVTAQGSPDMTLAVAAGEVFISGAKALVAAGNVTITTADASNPRIDLVVVNSSGTKSVTAGTAAANPKAPDIPASSVLLAMVYVPAGDTTMASNQITDKRVLLRPVITEGRFKVGATPNYTLPGVEITAASTSAITANVIRYMPILVLSPITIDRLALEVTGAGAGSTTARIAIYHADTDWQPLALVVDSGTLAVDSTGEKAATVSATLQPGRYLLAINSDGAPTLRFFRGGGMKWAGILAGFGANPLPNQLTVSLAYAAFLSTGTAWTAQSSGAVLFAYWCALRIATP